MSLANYRKKEIWKKAMNPAEGGHPIKNSLLWYNVIMPHIYIMILGWS